MALILDQKAMGGDMFALTLSGVPEGGAGQFLLLHPPAERDPFLPRPISLFDSYGDTAMVVYRVAGRGTALISRLREGDALRVTGPVGRGFPLGAGPAVLIGGGIGIAPLHLLAKRLRAADPGRRIVAYLGYSDRLFLTGELAAVCDAVITDVGGFITDRVPTGAGTYYACGPEPMLRAAAAKLGNERLYVSMERHMGCGVGACFACSIRTRDGNRRVCRDGPVFDAREVFYG